MKNTAANSGSSTMRVALINHHWWYDRRLSTYHPGSVGHTMSTKLTESRFRCTQLVLIKIPENFNIKHLHRSKTDLSKETKKETLKRDNLRISVAVVCRDTFKKVSLKLSPSVYLHIIKIDIKQWTTTYLNLSKSLYQNKQPLL